MKIIEILRFAQNDDVYVIRNEGRRLSPVILNEPKASEGSQKGLT